MSVTVLILERFAESYRVALTERFAGLTVHAAKHKEDIEVDLSSVNVLVAFGIAIDDDLMQRASRLRWVQSLATGVDHFLSCPHLRPETILTSARGIHGAPMRETVAYLMLASARNGQRLHRDQSVHRWDRGQPWSLLDGKCAVVVGTGVSAMAIAQLLKAFGMRVTGVSNAPRIVEGFDEILPGTHLIEAAARADYLINVLPGGPQNRDRINAAVFAAMKPTSRFINVGRGETVDEAALIDVLRAERIAGAALDVFRSEPLGRDSPLWDMPNVIVTPHIAGYIAEYENLVMPILIENMERFLAGQFAKMRNVIPHK